MSNSNAYSTLEGERTDDDSSSLESALVDAFHHRGTLYGRQIEQQQIVQAYNRVLSSASSKQRKDDLTATGAAAAAAVAEFVLIMGPPGVGKSGLARSLQHQVEDNDHGYLISSKFHQMQRPEPHLAFEEAIAEFVTRVLDRGDAHTYRDAILQFIPGAETGSHSLLEMFPSLQTLFNAVACDQMTATTKGTRSLTNSECPSDDIESDEDDSNNTKAAILLSDNRLLPIDQKPKYGKDHCRFKEALRLLVHAIAIPFKPLVWVLDDLHWADENSLATIHSLLSDDCIARGVLFIGTHRCDVDAATERIQRAVRRFQVIDVNKTYIELYHGLKECEIVIMLAETLQSSQDRVKPFAAYILSQTSGNVYFVWELLRELYDRGTISFHVSTGQRYQWEMKALPEKFNNGIYGLIQTKFESLDITHQEHLKIAACLGSTLNEAILTMILAPSGRSFAALTSETTSRGLVCFDDARCCWRFSHDVVRDAIYELVLKSEPRAYHYRIGRKLWRMFNINELAHFIFLVVDLLTFTMDCLVDDKERTAVAKLCLCAGIRSVKLSNFMVSLDYLERGISLLAPRSWLDDPDLCRDIHCSAAEVANSLGKYERVHELVGMVVEHGRSLNDIIRAQATLVHALGSSGKFSDALKLGFELLKRLGEPFLSKPNRMQIALEIVSLRRRLRAKSNEAILRLPYMVDDNKLAVMQLLNLVFFYALIDNCETVPLIGIRLVRLTLDYGLCAVSCIGFVLFAGTVSGVGLDFQEGRRLGQLGFALYEKFGNKSWLARISVLSFDFVHGWMNPLDSCCAELDYACQVGLETGDIEFALGCEMVSFYNRFETEKIPLLTKHWDRLKRQLDFYGHKATVLMTVATRQLMENLTQIGINDPHVLEGLYLDDSYARVIESNYLVHAWSQIQSSLLKILFGLFQEAAADAREGRILATSAYGPHCGGFNTFVCGFAEVAHARQKRYRSAPYTRRCSKLLRRFADKGETLYFIGKHYLLEAELAALSGKSTRALALYTVAISTSEKARLRMQTALANERIAKLLWEKGEHLRAHAHFREARNWYKSWGASVKVEHLEHEMNKLGIGVDVPVIEVSRRSTFNFAGEYNGYK